MTNFTKEDLLYFNEVLLGRGMPVQQDGIGYNKADYGACSTYYHGLSDAQLADLAKRLVKYTETQLKISKDTMKQTAKELAEKLEGADRSAGISLEIKEDGTLISFRYNETFIDTIKKQPKRQWDAERKNWVVPNDNLIQTLRALETVGADVKNAIEYSSNHELVKSSKEPENQLTEVLTKVDGDYALLKFSYNKDILEEIKQIDRKDRQWNPDFKFWSINKNCLQTLQDRLSSIAIFKQI